MFLEINGNKMSADPLSNPRFSRTFEVESGPEEMTPGKARVVARADECQTRPIGPGQRVSLSSGQLRWYLESPEKACVPSAIRTCVLIFTSRGGYPKKSVIETARIKLMSGEEENDGLIAVMTAHGDA